MIFSLNSLMHFSNNYFIKNWFPDLSTRDVHSTQMDFNFISSMASLLFIPFCGIIADKYSLHSHMSVLSPIITQISFILYILMNPYIPCILYTFAYSLNYTGVWSNVCNCVDDKNMV